MDLKTKMRRYKLVNHPAQAIVWVGPVRQGLSEKTVSC